MKTALIAVVLALSPLAALAGTCVGADPCLACHDCSQCWYCNPKNPHAGSCGVLRNQDSKAAAKRLKKQGLWPTKTSN